MIFGRKLKSQIIKQDMKIIEKSYATENAIVLGHPGKDCFMDRMKLRREMFVVIRK